MAHSSSAPCQDGECVPASISAEDFAWDPTMASCCIRDLQNQLKGDALRQKLLAVDPTRPHDRVVRNSLPISEPPGAPHLSSGLVSDSQCGDEDTELAALRERRKGELLQRMQQASNAQASGFGRLNEVSGTQLLERLESSTGCSVCHCAVEGHEPSNQLDQHLEALAHLYQGTLFMRTLVRRNSPLKKQLNLTHLPGLVCFRNGVVVGRTGLHTFGPIEEVFEELVVDYLKRLGVLRQSAQRGGGPTGNANPRAQMGDGSEEESDGAEEVDTWKNAPCEVCGRRYPHEHVKAVYRDHHSTDDEGSDFD